MAKDLEATNATLTESKGKRQEAPVSSRPPAGRGTTPSDPDAATCFDDAIIDTTNVMIIVLDPRGRITRFNRAAERITGLGSPAVVGSPIWDKLVPENERKRFSRAMEVLEIEGPPCQVEGNIRTRDGTLRLVLWNFDAIKDETGSLKWIVGTGIDVTEQKTLQDQLQRADKMRAMGELATGIAHDFNNIITGVRGHIQLLRAKLQKGVAGKDDIYATLEKMEGSTAKARELVGQILKFARDVPSKQEEVDLNRLISEVVLVLEPALGKAEVDLELELAKEAPVVAGDPVRLQQVILNLAVNAIHASSRNGKIVIRTAISPCMVGPSGWCAVIEVEDNGTGMDPGLKERIFEPYFTTKVNGREGSGLGLFVVYNIVKLHHGRIDVWSQPNQGTRFSVYLPLAGRRQEGAAGRPLAKKQPSPPSKSGGIMVLAVEKDQALRDFLSEGLSLLGYRNITAASGKEAVELCEKLEGEVHVALIDCFISDMSSTELVERLRRIRPGLKGIIMSGYFPDADDIKQAPGVFEVLLKPFSIYDLKSLLAQLAAEKRS